MITFKTLGRNGQLGNQFFQIAATISHAKRNNDIAVFPEWLDIRSGDDYSEILQNPIISNNAIVNSINTEICTETSLKYCNIPYQNNTTIRGYLQSEKYFSDNIDGVNTQLQPSEDIERDIKDRYSYIDFSKCIGCHFRAYSTPGYDTTGMHYMLPIEYFQSAVKKFGPNRIYVVSSDNIDLCKKWFGHYRNFIFLEGNKPFVDLYILSKCSNVIACNSTFSWWAGWLCEQRTGNAPVVPDRSKWYTEHAFKTQPEWFDMSDIYPDRWIKNEIKWT